MGRAGNALTPRQNKLFGAIGNQLLGNVQPQRAQPTGDEIDSIVMHRDGCARRRARGRGGGHRDYNLADLFRLLHIAEGSDHLLPCKPCMGQRLERTRLQLLGHRAPQPRVEGWIAAHRFAQVEGIVGHIRARLCHLGMAPDAKFADLDKTALLTQDRQAAVDKVTIQAVEDNIHPSTVGDLHNFLSKGQGARVERMGHPLAL